MFAGASRHWRHRQAAGGGRADLQRMAAAGVEGFQEEQELRAGLPQALCTSRAERLQEQAEVLQSSPADEARTERHVCIRPALYQASCNMCSGTSLQEPPMQQGSCTHQLMCHCCMSGRAYLEPGRIGCTAIEVLGMSTSTWQSDAVAGELADP